MKLLFLIFVIAAVAPSWGEPEAEANAEANAEAIPDAGAKPYYDELYLPQTHVYANSYHHEQPVLHKHNTFVQTHPVYIPKPVVFPQDIYVKKPVVVHKPVYIRKPIYIPRPVYHHEPVYIERPIYVEKRVPEIHTHEHVSVHNDEYGNHHSEYDHNKDHNAYA